MLRCPVSGGLHSQLFVKDECTDVIGSLVPSPSPQLSSLAVRITLRVIRTASDNSCGGGLGTRLRYRLIECCLLVTVCIE